MVTSKFRMFTMAFVMTLCLSGTAYAGIIDLAGHVPVSPNQSDPFSVTDMGVMFTFTPIANGLPAAPEWRGGPDVINFGGGGGSSLEFTFVTNADVTLDSYTIDSVLNDDPLFDIKQDTTVLSAANSGGTVGTFGFDGGPLSLTNGATYTWLVNPPGVSNQASLGALNFTPAPVPTPSAILLMATGLLGLLLVGRRRAG